MPYPRLKYWMARSCFSAACRVRNVPRFFRRPLLASFLREYERYSPDGNLRIIFQSQLSLNVELQANDPN